MSFKIELKNEYRTRFELDLNLLLEKFVEGSLEYFMEIRKKSIKYWLDLDRYDIFEDFDEISGNSIYFRRP